MPPPNSDEAVLGRTTLFGLLLERLERWKGEVSEKRRFFVSLAGLSTVVEDRIMDFSGVVIIIVDALDIGVINSGSSDASREEGMESVRELGESCITNITISTCPRDIECEMCDRDYIQIIMELQAETWS